MFHWFFDGEASNSTIRGEDHRYRGTKLSGSNNRRDRFRKEHSTFSDFVPAGLHRFRKRRRHSAPASRRSFRGKVIILLWMIWYFFVYLKKRAFVFWGILGIFHSFLSFFFSGNKQGVLVHGWIMILGKRWGKEKNTRIQNILEYFVSFVFL